MPAHPQPLPLQQAIIDSGLQQPTFVNAEAAQAVQIPLWPKPIPDLVGMINRSLLSSGPVAMETIPLKVTIQRHRVTLQYNAIHVLHFPLSLGISWLVLPNPLIYWSEIQFEFFSECCQQYSLTPGYEQCTIVPYQSHARVAGSADCLLNLVFNFHPNTVFWRGKKEFRHIAPVPGTMIAHSSYNQGKHPIQICICHVGVLN